MRTAITQLQEAAVGLEQPGMIVSLAAAAVAHAVPRGMTFAYDIRDWPARTIGKMGLHMEGEDADFNPFPTIFPHIEVGFGRVTVQVEQRNKVVEVFRTSSLTPETLRSSSFRGMLDHYRVLQSARCVVCLGARPVGNIGAFIPEGSAGFTARELTNLRLVAQAALGPLRLSALLGGWTALTDAVDHLMASRLDASLLVSENGMLMGASTRGERMIERYPELVEVLRREVRAGVKHARAVSVGGCGVELSLTPCSPRGGASAVLAVLGVSPPAGRGKVSARQADLVEHLSRGQSNAEIAQAMGLSSATIKTMLERLYARHRVSGRVALLDTIRRGT